MKILKNKRLYLSIILICILYILIIFYIKEGNDIKQNTLYKVNYIYDGDTISILYKGRQKTIRLLGIDTPETVDPRKPVQCFGEQASLKTKELLNNRSISLVFNLNREQKDKYNRYLGYVYRDDGLDINRYLIEHGYAREYTYGKPYERQKEFRKLEKQAKERSIGLWNTDNCPQMQ
jgi:micrococcal nuclease